MFTRRAVIVNTLTQVFGRVLGLVITLLTINYISNNFTVNGSTLSGFGQYTIVFTYAAIIGTAADLGLFTLLVRELTGKSPEEGGVIIGASLYFRLTLFVVSIFFVYLFTLFLPYDASVKLAILLSTMVAFSILLSQIFAAVFQVNMDSSKILITETIGKFAIFIATTYAISHEYGITGLVYANVLGNLVTLILAAYWARKYIKISFLNKFKLMKEYLPSLLPIAIISVLSLAHFKVDMILLSLLTNQDKVGIYGISFKLMEIALIIPYIISSNLLPVISSMTFGSLSPMTNLIKKASHIVFYAGSICAVFLLVFAPMVVTFVASEDFLDAVLPLRILSIAMIFIFVSTFITQALIAVKKQDLLVKAYITVLVANILINLLLIPRFTYNGAAISTLISEFVLLLWSVSIAKKFFGSSNIITLVNAVKLLSLGIISGIISVLTIRFSVNLGWFISQGKLTQALILVAILIATLSIAIIVLYFAYGKDFRRLKMEFLNL